MTKAKSAPKPGVNSGRARTGPVPRKVVDQADRRLAGAQRMVIAVVLGLTAVSFWRPLLDPFMVLKVTVLVLGALVLVALAGVRALRAARLTVPGPPVLWLVAALALALMLATASADNVALALVGQNRRSAGSLSYAAYLAIFLVAVRLYAGDRARGPAQALLLGLAAVTAYGLLQVAGLDPFAWSTGGLDATFSTMGNINFAAGYVGTVVPLAAAVALFPVWSRPWRVTGVVLFVLGAVYLFANGSAQGPVAAAAGLVVVIAALLLSRRRGGGLATPGARWLLGAGAAVALGVTAVVALRAAPEVVAGLSERRYFWRAAVDIFADHPVVGAGFDSFRDQFTRYRAPEHAVFLGYDGADSPHNVPLGMLSGGGLPLLLSYLAFVVYTGFALVRGLLARPSERQWALAAFGGVWAAYQVQSLVSVDVPGVTHLHFVSAAIVLAVARPPRELSLRLPVTPAARGSLLPRAGSGAGRPLAGAALAALLVIALVAAWTATRPLRADLAAGSGTRKADASEKVDRLAQAVRLAPWEAEYRLAHGRALIEAGATGAAYREALKAADLRRGSSKLALGAADFARRSRDDELAETWTERALERDPNNPVLLEDVAAVLRERGDATRADELEQRAARLRVEHADY